MDWNKMLDGTALWAFGGVAVTQLLTWAYQRQRARLDGAAAARQAEAEARKAETVDRDAAFRNLMEVVRTLKEDVADLRKRLDDERELRRQLRTELDQERRQRLEAEGTVRVLRDELDALRNTLVGPGPPPLPARAG